MSSHRITKDEFYQRIKAERKRQHEKWGEQHHSHHKWLSILTEEVGEVAEAVNKNDTEPDQQPLIIEELVQCAAVIEAWLVR